MMTTPTDRNRTNAGWAMASTAKSPANTLQWAVMLTAIAVLGLCLYLATGPVISSSRPPLGRALNVAADLSASLMYGMTALVVIFGVVVVGMSLARPEK